MTPINLAGPSSITLDAQSVSADVEQAVHRVLQPGERAEGERAEGERAEGGGCSGGCGSSKPASVDRRRFFGLASAMSAGALVATGCGDSVFGVPSTITPLPGVLPKVDPRTVKELSRVGGVAVINADGYGPIAVERLGEGSYRAFSLACPHRGTFVKPTATGFKCPNHQALFTVDGKWSGGKETGDLPELSVAVDEDGLLVIGGTAATPIAPASPMIAVSPAAEVFTAVRGAASPVPQLVTITNSGAGALADLAAVVGYTDGQPAGWLTASLDAASAPAILTLTVNSAGLEAGVLQATVQITARTAANGPIAMPVTLVVIEPAVAPAVLLSPAAVAFATTQGGSVSSQSVQVLNSGGGTLRGLTVGVVAYGPGASDWLTITRTGDTAPATLAVGAAVSALAVGSYSATVPITGTGAVSGTMLVTLIVEAPTAAPDVLLTPAAVSFSVVDGDPSPAPSMVNVTRDGGGALSGLTVSGIAYVSGGTGWLAATLNQAAVPAVLTVTPSTAALAVGTHTARITVRSTSASAPKEVLVTCVVTARGIAPAIMLSSTSLAFTTLRGASPSAESVTISNSGGGALSGLSTAAVVYGAGATGWLTATLSSTTSPATLSCTVSSSTLAPGTYTASVRVSATTASNGPQTLTVTLTVTAPAAVPTMALSATAATFNATAGGAVPAQSITVTNSGTGALAGVSAGAVSYGAGATGWLAVTASGALAPVTLSLAVTTGALAAGTYTATFAVAATGVPAQTVTVTLVIAGVPSLSLSSASATFSAATGATPTAQTITISNGGSGTLTGLAYAVAYASGAGWLSSSTLTSATAPAVLTLRATTTGLAAGTYTATVTVTGTGVTAKTIAVTLTVTASGLAVVIASWPALANVGGIAGTVGNVGGQPTAVVRTGANTFAAYSLRCPHNGTTVRIENWQSTGSAFHCPNHDAIFTSAGVCMPASPQRTTNLVARTVTYTAGDTTLYIA